MKLTMSISQILDLEKKYWALPKNVRYGKAINEVMEVPEFYNKFKLFMLNHYFNWNKPDMKELFQNSELFNQRIKGNLTDSITLKIYDIPSTMSAIVIVIESESITEFTYTFSSATYNTQTEEQIYKDNLFYTEPTLNMAYETLKKNGYELVVDEEKIKEFNRALKGFVSLN